MKKNIIIPFLLACVLTFSGCMWGAGSLWNNRVTDENLKSTAQAAASKEAAINIESRAEEIRSEAKAAKKELAQDVKDKALAADNAARKIDRWIRVDENAEEIADKADGVESQSGKILRINNGTIELTWWGWGIIVCIIGLIGLAVFTYITILLKQWGILKAIRIGVEGTSELVTKSWIADDTKDNLEIPPDLLVKAVNKRRMK